MKIKSILVKALSFVLCISMFGTLSLLPNRVANALTSQESNVSISSPKLAYEDSTYKVTEVNNVRTVLNKKTLQTITLTFTNSQHSKGIYKDIDGNTQEYSTDFNGNMYLNGNRVVNAKIEAKQSTPLENSLTGINAAYSTSGYTNPKYFIGSDGRTYYYVITYTYDTYTQGNINNIVMGILSFIPYAGTSIALYGIVQAFQSLGQPVMYIKEEQYCTSSYQFYAFKNYFYKYSNYTGLVNTTTVYKRMW